MKTCFKCGRHLPLSDYYAHPMMKDGHLNKCKVCSCKDTAAHVAKKSKDPVWLEAEMERHRLKQQRARAEGKACVLRGEAKRLVHQRHKEKYPERSQARGITARAIKAGRLKRKPCVVCGNTDSEAHHEDYSQPLLVRWLCPKHHAERHRQIRKEQRARTLQR